MTIIANNNVNSGNSTLSLGPSVLNSADGVGLTGNFLDIISMLSQNSDLNLITKGSPELLSDGSNIDSNFSTLQLLQNFLDEHDVNSKTKMPPELASKFFELLDAGKKLSEKTQIVVHDTINPKGLPTQKILIDRVHTELKPNNFKENLVLNGHVESDGEKTPIKFSGEESLAIDNLRGAADIPQVSQSIVNTSILNDSKQNTVVVDLGKVLDEASSEFDHLHIAKVYTVPLSIADNNTPEEFSKDNTQIAHLNIDLGRKSIKINSQTEGSPVFQQEVLIPDETKAFGEVVSLEIDKVVGTTLIMTLSSEQVKNSANLPRKIVLRFSEAKPLSSNMNVNSSLSSDENFSNVEKFIDTNHATILARSNLNSAGEVSETDHVIKVFNPEYKISSDKNSYPILEVETFSEDFSDEIASKLKTFLSGELHNKYMLNNLREAIIIDSNREILTDSVKVQLAGLINSMKRGPKAKLLLSTADVIGYRETVKLTDKKVFDFQSFEPFRESITWGERVHPDIDLEAFAEKVAVNKIEENVPKINLIETVKQPNQTIMSEFRNLGNNPSVGMNTFINSLNVYEAQFTSRLGMLLADQIAQGSENFELQLEPESFGKVRVNVSLENSNVEIKMVAENSAAVLALRGGENMLQTIAEQHGLKLSDYSVDMQNNQNGQSSDQKGDLGKRGETESNKIEDVEQELSSNSTDGKHKLNLLA